jgi:hypothetical protein
MKKEKVAEPIFPQINIPPHHTRLPTISPPSKNVSSKNHRHDLALPNSHTHTHYALRLTHHDATTTK